MTVKITIDASMDRFIKELNKVQLAIEKCACEMWGLVDHGPWNDWCDFIHQQWIGVGVPFAPDHRKVWPAQITPKFRRKK